MNTKKFFLMMTVALFSLVALARDPGVDAKVLDHFQKTFKGATDVVWSHSGTNYEASFTLNEVKSRVTYDQDANVTKTIRYYDGDGLPLMLASKIKARYPKKTVYGVTEITTDEDGTIYHIVLQDDKEWVNLSADPLGTMHVESRYKKA